MMKQIFYHRYNKKIGVLSIVLLALSGCATIMSGSTQVIHVQAIEASTHQVIKTAKCTVRNSKEVIFAINENPGTVTVPREYGNLETSCRAKGYHQLSVGVGQSFNAWTIANVFFWPGLIVDAATGATTKYPSYITVLMEKKSNSNQK